MTTPCAPPLAPLPTHTNAQQEGPYQDIVGLWSDLEAALGLLLAQPALVQQLPSKVEQLDHWLQELIAQDHDTALYLMFQLAGSSTVGYSASHALVCATLCHILAQELALSTIERDALVRAALTMNIGMTVLQDQLALQRERPSAAQMESIRMHPVEGQQLLQHMGVSDDLWLEVVGLHHINTGAQHTLQAQAPAERLARILTTCDRYAAMISPRRSRAGRSVAESVQAITGPHAALYEQTGSALVRCVGLYPPGVYVALSSGETAVVLRRTDITGQPLVAKLLDARKAPLRQPTLLLLDGQSQRISHALPSAEVSLQVDHRAMVRLGMYAAQHSQGLARLTALPGMR